MIALVSVSFLGGSAFRLQLTVRVFLLLDVLGELTLLEALCLLDLSVSGFFDMILDLSKLLRGVRVAEQLVEGAHIFLEDVFDSGELISVRGTSLRHLLNEGNVAGSTFLGVSLKIKWAHPEEFLVGADFLLVLTLGHIFLTLGAALRESP